MALYDLKAYRENAEGTFDEVLLTASILPYSPSGTGMEASFVKDAIDELLKKKLPQSGVDNHLYEYSLLASGSLTEVVSDLSGIAYSPITNTLFAIRGNLQILEYSITGTYLRAITQVNFIDCESICWMYGNTFAIAEEINSVGAGANRITIITINSETTSIDRTSGTTVTPDVTSAANKGIEGITYDPFNNCFYIALEKQADGNNNGRIYKVLMDGTATLLTDLTNALASAGNTDLSDLYFNPGNKKLFVLSHEAKRISECTLDGQILGTFSVSSFTQPEGITFTGDYNRMIVAGEATEIAYYSRNVIPSQSTWLISGSNVYYSAGKVAIGHSSPSAFLDLRPSDSSAATDFLINPTAKTSGNLIDAQVNGTSKFKVDYAGLITTNRIDVIDSTYPVARVTRTGSYTNEAKSTIVYRHMTSGDMADGFGVDVSFQIRDSAGVDNEIANIAAVREGADSYGALVFSTRTSGTATERLRIRNSGAIGIGTSSATAWLHIKAGTATAGTAPLKLTSGTNLSTAEAGAMEYDGTNLYFTPSGTTRKTFQYTTDNQDISTALGTNLSYQGTIETGTVGENVAFGDVLYLKFSDGKWWKAKADAYATTPGVRMALATINANASGVLLVKGNVRNDSWSLASSRTYLSAATAGAITTTQPSTAGNQIQLLGIAKSATTLFFSPSIDVGEV